MQARALSTSLRAQRSNPSFRARGGNGLLRCAHDDDVKAMPATNWRDEQITSDFQKWCQAQKSKTFCFRSHANQSHNSARLTADEGRSRTSRTRGEMRWTLMAR